MKMKNLFVLLATIMFLISCEEEVSPPKYKYIQNLDLDHGLLNYQSYINGDDAHSGRFFSRADSAINFGFFYSYIIPDSLIGKNLFVNVDAWVRNGDLSNQCEFIVSAKSKDSLLLWQSCDVRQTIKAANEWVNIKKIVSLPSSMTSLPNFRVDLLAHNIDAKSYFDVDDVNITFFEQGAE